MKEIRVEITFMEEVLGTASTDPLRTTQIAGNAPDEPSREEEIEAVEAVGETGMTVFPRTTVDGNSVPIFWDYQIKGFFKDAAGMLRKVPGTKSSALKAYKKAVDGLIFVEPRKIPIVLSGPMGECHRPLRAQTAQGERIALAHSESIPEGSYISITIKCLDDSLVPAVLEWLDYGELRGIGQWRNSGKGRFSYELA